mgnify:CR=1 FL=1
MSLQTVFHIGKGGVGKSTTSAVTAIQFARNARDTLLVSMDPAFQGDVQLNLTLADSSYGIQTSGILQAQLHEMQLYPNTLGIKTSIEGDLIRRGEFLETSLQLRDMSFKSPRKVAQVEEMNAFFKSDSISSVFGVDGDFFHAGLQMVRPLDGLDSLGRGYRDYFSSFRNASHIAADSRLSFLPGIEAEARDLSKAARPAALVFGSVRLGGVLDHPESTFRCDLVDRVHVRHLAEEVDRDHGLSPGGYPPLEIRHVYVIGIGVDLRKHHLRAGSRYGLSRRDKGVGGYDHLVAFAYLERSPDRVQRDCAIRHRHSMARACPLRELRLEITPLRTRPVIHAVGFEDPRDGFGFFFNPRTFFFRNAAASV